MCGAELLRTNSAYKSIGYKRLTGRRSTKLIPNPPGGNLNDYVPFYFCPRSPMLCSIANKNSETYGGGQEDVIHIVVEVDLIVEQRLQFAFTDRHAVVSHARFFDNTNSFDQLDWKVINDTAWQNSKNDPDRKERKQAEFLVYKFVPWNLIIGIGVHNEGIRKLVEQYLPPGSSFPKVKVMSKWYY